LAGWQPDNPSADTPLLRSIAERIANNSPLLANYVRRYFHDMAAHLSRVTNILQPDAKVFYIVGNSKFYDTIVPTEQLLKQQMLHIGYRCVTIEPLRKRNSKKELLEYLISADWNPNSAS
jgi:predicted NBD/HSP70 family sugar kinase